MDLHKCLTEIMTTAVKAAGYREYQVSEQKRLLTMPDGKTMTIKNEPDPIVNNLLTLDDAARIFNERFDTAAAWVGEEKIHVEHVDASRMDGHSILDLIKAPAMRYIIESEEKVVAYAPDEFERIAKLYFGADALFISRLRKLQWKDGAEVKQQIANASKSASVDMLTKVLDADGNLFEDVTLDVTTPVYVHPFRTSEKTITLNIIANAAAKTISFAPFPGQVMDCVRTSVKEIRDALAELLVEDGCESLYMGSPEK